MKEENIHKIIDQYFDGRLSCQEEDELLHSLLAHDGDDSKVNEALAVMLMARSPQILAPERKPAHLLAGRFFRHRGLKGAAAVALVVISCVTALLYPRHNAGGEMTGMMAYVGGVKVSDHSEIMKIVDDQLNEICMSTEFFTQTVASDLSEIRNAFNEEDL